MTSGAGKNAPLETSKTRSARPYNATSAESAEFRVPSKPPEVFIEPPSNGGRFVAGQAISLNADVDDLQDDELPDSALEWSSNVSGPLGTGSSLTLKSLSVGPHVITLTATNSAGLKTSKSIQVTVVAR